MPIMTIPMPVPCWNGLIIGGVRLRMQVRFRWSPVLVRCSRWAVMGCWSWGKDSREICGSFIFQEIKIPDETPLDSSFVRDFDCPEISHLTVGHRLDWLPRSERFQGNRINLLVQEVTKCWAKTNFGRSHWIVRLPSKFTDYSHLRVFDAYVA